jgi:ADP-ribosylglycohydrolase
MSLWSNIVRGVATGDAWGDPVEFNRIGSITTATNPKGLNLPKDLRITDDTQMTLFLADALAVSWGEDMDTVKAVIAKAFLDYYDDPDTGSRAPGGTVMGSLGWLSRGAPWQKATNPGSDGSGTVMRTSPTAFLPQDRWVGVTAFAAAITHGAANAIAAAILNAAILRDLMRGQARPGELLEHAYDLAANAVVRGLTDTGEWLDGYEIPGGLQSGFDELARLLGEVLKVLPQLQADPWSLKNDPSNQAGMDTGQGGGWRGHHTLVIALTAVDTFPGNEWEALRRAAMTNGDSDTIGAVAGGLIGAAYPGTFTENWTGTLMLRERLEKRYAEWIEEADTYPFTDPATVLA